MARRPRLPGDRTVREWFRMMREYEDDDERVQRDVEIYRSLGRGTSIFDLDEAAGGWDVGSEEPLTDCDPGDESDD